MKNAKDDDLIFVSDIDAIDNDIGQSDNDKLQRAWHLSDMPEVRELTKRLC